MLTSSQIPAIRQEDRHCVQQSRIRTSLVPPPRVRSLKWLTDRRLEQEHPLRDTLAKRLSCHVPCVCNHKSQARAEKTLPTHDRNVQACRWYLSYRRPKFPCCEYIHVILAQFTGRELVPCGLLRVIHCGWHLTRGWLQVRNAMDLESRPSDGLKEAKASTVSPCTAISSKPRVH